MDIFDSSVTLTVLGFIAVFLGAEALERYFKRNP